MEWWKREAVQNNSQGPVVEMSHHRAVSKTQPLSVLQGDQHKRELFVSLHSPVKISEIPF